MGSIVWKSGDIEIEECDICPDKSGKYCGSGMNENAVKKRGEYLRRLHNAFDRMEIWETVI